MAANIEKLLRLVADYDSFCANDYAKAGKTDTEELSLEELDLVAAATGAPVHRGNPEKENRNQD